MNIEANHATPANAHCLAAQPMADSCHPLPLEPLRSTHTSTFPELLAHFGVSVLVTTYQAGRLVMLRADGDVLNTHFRLFPKPMGMAVPANLHAAGTEIGNPHDPNYPAVTLRAFRPGTLSPAPKRQN